MPTQKLPLLAGRRLLAWETVRDRLMRDSDLRRINVDWHIAEGPTDDDPPVEGRVSIYLWPKNGPAERAVMTGWGGTDSLKILTISYEIFAPGGPQEDWAPASQVNDAVERCLSGRWDGNRPTQPAEYQAYHKAMQDGGVDDLDILSSADWNQPGVISVTCYEAS